MITLILIIPSMFELCVNACLAILRAKNQLGFFTATLFSAAVLNAVVTIVAVKNWSYIGAAVGTALSVIVGNLVVMNIYFTKKLKLPMLRIYGSIFRRIWVCLLLAGGVLYVVSRYVYGTLGAFLVDVCVFCVVYASALWFFGLEKEEKKNIPLLNRFIKS